MAMLKLYGHSLKSVKMSCGCKLIEVLFYVGVSRRNLLFFLVYAVKNPPGQRKICSFFIHNLIADTPSKLFVKI